LRHALDRGEQVISGIAGPRATAQHIVDPLPAAVGDIPVDAAALAASHHLAQKVVEADRAALGSGSALALPSGAAAQDIAQYVTESATA
jgi:hypothetical protein